MCIKQTTFNRKIRTRHLSTPKITMQVVKIEFHRVHLNFVNEWNIKYHYCALAYMAATEQILWQFSWRHRWSIPVAYILHHGQLIFKTTRICVSTEELVHRWYSSLYSSPEDARNSSRSNCRYLRKLACSNLRQICCDELSIHWKNIERYKSFAVVNWRASGPSSSRCGWRHFLGNSASWTPRSLMVHLLWLMTRLVVAESRNRADRSTKKTVSLSQAFWNQMGNDTSLCYGWQAGVASWTVNSTFATYWQTNEQKSMSLIEAG